MVALITGVTGQDGSYLSELLLARGYTVHGLVRRSSTTNTRNIDHLRREDGFHLHTGDLLDAGGLHRLVDQLQPTEVYNLGAQSEVHLSFDVPYQTGLVNGLGATNLLEALRVACPHARYYQASSSEMFGQVRETPQSETTPFHPRSPYAASKVYAYWLTVNYRESYGLFACNGILFNHESPRRGERFLTRKVARAVAEIELGLRDTLPLGNLSARRDWGYAPEYVDAMWRMLQQDEAQDFVIGTGENHSVEEWVQAAFAHVGRDWQEYVLQDPALLRPAEVDQLLADASKAQRVLGWTPTVRFAELVGLMVDAELRSLRG